MLDNHDPTIRVEKRGRHWAVYDPSGALICLTVYKKGGMEVLRRLNTLSTDLPESHLPPGTPGESETDTDVPNRQLHHRNR
jgi:hypothetical protein